MRPRVSEKEKSDAAAATGCSVLRADPREQTINESLRRRMHAPQVRVCEDDEIVTYSIAQA